MSALLYEFNDGFNDDVFHDNFNVEFNSILKYISICVSILLHC